MVTFPSHHDPVEGIPDDLILLHHVAVGDERLRLLRYKVLRHRGISKSRHGCLTIRILGIDRDSGAVAIDLAADNAVVLPAQDTDAVVLVVRDLGVLQHRSFAAEEEHAPVVAGHADLRERRSVAMHRDARVAPQLESVAALSRLAAFEVLDHHSVGADIKDGALALAVEHGRATGAAKREATRHDELPQVRATGNLDGVAIARGLERVAEVLVRRALGDVPDRVRRKGCRGRGQ